MPARGTQGGWLQLCLYVCTHVLECAHVHLLACELGARESFSPLNPLSTLPEALAPPLLLEALSITPLLPPFLPRGEHHSAGSRAQPDPPLLLPLIHSFGRQNPSPRGTCLTEGKNRDEIAGCGSIPSIPFSISAVVHQPVVVVVDVGVVVWLDTAPCPVTENRAAEL